MDYKLCKLHFFSILMCLIMFSLTITCSFNNPYLDDSENSQQNAAFSITGADSLGIITVELSFNEQLNQSDVVDLSNYSIPLLTVMNAELLSDNSTIRLLTTTQENRQYTVTVSNISNMLGDNTIASPNNSASFNGTDNTTDLDTFIPDITVTTTIQAAIILATPGDVIYIPAGTYDEDINVNKFVSLIGAGSGSNPASNTVIQSTSGIRTEHTIHITVGGESSTNRMVLANLYVTGDLDNLPPNGNDGTAIMINSSLPNTVDHIEFQNVASVNNEGHGIAVDSTAALIDDIVISYCNLSNNGNHGFRVPSSLASITNLEISNSVFNNNTGPGLQVISLDTNSNMTITNCTFSGNASNEYQLADLLFTEYIGDGSISNILITSNDTESGIRFSGQRDNSYSSPRPGLPLGTLTFANIVIDGTQISLGSYPSSAITFTRSSDMSNVSFSGIRLMSDAPNGLFFGTISGPTFSIGTIVFDGNYAIGDLVLGRHGNSTSYRYTVSDIDASLTSFVGAANDSDIEARVFHFPDDANLGTVTWTTP